MKSLESGSKFVLDLREVTVASDVPYLLAKFPKTKMVYVGSSFCGRYFFSCREIVNAWKKKNVHVSLTVPIMSQNELREGKKLLREAAVDEIIVNDLGMYNYTSKELGYKVGLGRLFHKEPRDARFPMYLERVVTPWIDIPGKVSSIELDPVANTMDLSQLKGDYEIALNHSYCYQSFGRICKYASIHLDMEKKFRSDSTCAYECLHHYEIHVNELVPDSKSLIRVGKALIFENSNVLCLHRSPDRLLYYPITELIERGGWQ